MWSRPAAAGSLLLLAATLCTAQPPSTVGRALPPDRAALERLHLQTEWTLYVPLEGARDTIDTVQAFDDQLFVQTRTGQLICVDARTGRVVWQTSLGNNTPSNVYPVGVNAQFVYATNVTKLYSFYRYTGVLEFVTDLGTTPTTGLAADETGVYAVLGARPGSAGAQRVAAYNLPRPIGVPVVTPQGGVMPGGNIAAANPIDELNRRYPSPGAVPRIPAPTPEEIVGTGTYGVGPTEVPTGGLTSTRSPSLAALPRVSPPYTLMGQPRSPSLQIVPALRQPYHLRDATSRDIQKTPSVAAIPPSVTAALALADLRPRGVEPTLRWEYGLGSRIPYPVLLTPDRVWAVTDARTANVVVKADRGPLLTHRFQDDVAAAPGRAGTVGYFPLADGTLTAADLASGTAEGGAVVPWRANVGGLLNHPPLVTADAVYASGDNSGVARVDRATGEVVWKSEAPADLPVAANQEFVYVRDRQGRLLIYDARRPADPTTTAAVPLSGINLPEFNIPVVNTATDRVYLASGNGLLVCLRDASPKYARPVPTAPEVTTSVAPRPPIGKQPDPKQPDATPPDAKQPDPKAPAPKPPGADDQPKKDGAPPDPNKKP